MKKILGLDLGTNSIGWAVVSAHDNGNPYEINGIGSRIIPMDAQEMGDFNKGNTISKTARRTKSRGARRLRERFLLRRERLHRVLNILGFLPEHYANAIGWDRQQQKTFGKFIDNNEPKIAWQEIDGKNQFLFMDSFKEMLSDFAQKQPDLVANNKKIPLDWTIYYLRKKALTQKISKEELAWLILNFNQKRGYYQLRGEDEDDGIKTAKTRKYFDKKKITKIIDHGKVDRGLKVLQVVLEDGNVGKILKKEIPQWIGLEKSIIITVDIDSNGLNKKNEDGSISQCFSIPTDDEWESEWKLIKLKTEKDLEDSKKYVGEFIYDSLLQNPSEKIIGKLVRTIKREFYKTELESILKKQSEFHEELVDKDVYLRCINELYYSNENQRNNISNWNLTDLFVKDIIFYQRPLKSKKSLISDCPFEYRYSESGERFSIKCIAKSHPLFQEFRLWKFVDNLKIYQRKKDDNGKLRTDVDVTTEFLKTQDDYVKLFEWLNGRKDIEQNVLLNSYFKLKKIKGKEAQYPYRWNYVEEKSYPCNETRNSILKLLNKAGISDTFLTKDIEESLWHILYSVEDIREIKKALESFAIRYQIIEKDIFVDIFTKFPPFKKEYGSFSSKAIKKLLSLMRMGEYWDETNIDNNTRKRIENIITGEYDKGLPNKVREKAELLTDISHFKGLPEWLACYIVYGRFSEVKDVKKWEKPEHLNEYIRKFKQHSLRNPIVEQLILESLRTVHDIWVKEKHIDEIHVELGREIKNSKEERSRITEKINKNEDTKHRIKLLLQEFKDVEYNIDNVIPHSPNQQEILKIYEEYALASFVLKDKPTYEQKKEYEFISKISKKSEPTKNEIQRYKLWLEQRYHSPYTGEIIPLGKLFTEMYQIEHIIPKSRFFDDSFSNKVICEAEVNSLKNNLLGYEFISNHQGQKVYLSTSKKTVEIFSIENYTKFINEHYSKLGAKKKKLLMDDIDDKFIERQLNDTKYITKEIKRLLSNIVREEGEEESTSKNLIPVTGAITSILKQNWGINNKWNELILPRFERLNKLTKSSDFIAYNTNGHKIPRVPIELQKGFSAKRIDHRHHAMDAIVIACTTRRHVQYLNNENARSQRYEIQKGLAKSLRRFEEVEIPTKVKNNAGIWIESSEKRRISVPKDFFKPWETFPEDVKKALDNVTASFKQYPRIINKSINLTQKFDNNGKKHFVRQTQGDSWAIRKPIHKDTVFGEVNLRKIKEVKLKEALENPKSVVEKGLKKTIIELQANGKDDKAIQDYFVNNKNIWKDINLSKIKVYYYTNDIKKQNSEKIKDRFFARRKELGSIFKESSSSFKSVDNVVKTINEKIADTGIKKILLRHLKEKGNKTELAFSPEGIEEMNHNISHLNRDKSDSPVPHQPIFKVRLYGKAKNFSIGETGNKKSKFVKAASDTNLFFAIYQEEFYNKVENKVETKRIYTTIPLSTVIERQKKGLKSVPETDENGNILLFSLSPNDLVYVPSNEEIKNGVNKDCLQKDRIYKMVSSDKYTCFFIPANVSYAIKNKYEFSSSNKMEKSITGEMIKYICIPIKVNRLGDIIAIGYSRTDD